MKCDCPRPEFCMCDFFAWMSAKTPEERREFWDNAPIRRLPPREKNR